MNHEIHQTHEMEESGEVRETGGGVLLRDESYRIMGACFEVYKTMGCGFLEPVYQECLEIELKRRGIPFVPQQPLHLTYAGEPLEQVYFADFVCYERIILELKAVTQLAPEHHAQLMNYLKATGLQLGILLNFGHYPQLEYKRIVTGRGRYM